MRKILLKALNWCIKKLEFLIYKFSVNKQDNLPYSSLAPIDNGDENGHYSKALFWALENRRKEGIKNIALTGSYGSGKSSILKTFQKNYKGNDLKFLNISLATFKEEKPNVDPEGNEIKIDKTDLLRLIETSILEQIFYHEKDHKIPDSRFKKIKSYKLPKRLLLSLCYLLLLLAFYNFFNANFIQSILKGVVISELGLNIIHYTGILIIVLGLFFIILKSVRIISAITVNKLKIQNAEIGVGENLNKSILNHHIDEILYFFSIRPYNVVIIEDLDRFQETEIFTKLREVNLLLNNSEKTKRRDIVFVYAVRDDMFTDKDRTKFFDFIIPVIPVINSSNSSEILLKKKNQFQYKLSDNLIEDISFFIDDMRLLHNISNEFYLYREKLNENLNQDKLFAIITYKNIYPNDFMKLSYNEGDLYTIFNLKTIFIKDLVGKLESEIGECKNQIEQLESLFLNNIKDLRLLYIVRIIEKSPGFKSFNINNKTLSIDDVTEESNFEYLRKNNYTFNQLVFDTYYNRETTQERNLSTTFSEIEKIVDQSKSYSIKEKEAKDIKEGKIVALKNKIQELDKQKQKTRNSRITDLFRSNQVPETELSKNINKDFITILLRNGYIAEDYIDYISLFHEESITRSDYQFHISIKNAIRQPFDYRIFKTSKLLSKINPIDFQTEYILNYDILDYLLSHSEEYKPQLESVFNKLKDESEISIEFIKGYFDVSQKLDDFIQLLCNDWSNIWGFIESNSDFSEDKKKDIFKSIIEYGDIDAIVEISKQSSFTRLILSDPLFLDIIKNHNKLKQVIQELNLVFIQIDFENSSDEMLLFIYENDHYQLNTEMITLIIKRFGDFKQMEFDNSNYYAIKTSKADRLNQHIETKMDDYIENVYLKISANINEKEEYYIELLNNENITIENKRHIISQVETKISKLSTINQNELNSFLFENNKITPTWGNLLFEYNAQNSDKETEPKIPDSIIGFINIIQNAEELSKSKIPKEVNSEDLFSIFWKKLIQIEKISDPSYDLITKSSPWWYSNLDFENLSKNKVESLINNNCINPTILSFESIKNSYNGLNIRLLEKQKGDFFKILDQLTFDDDDIELILKSNTLDNSEKIKIINQLSEDTYLTSFNLERLCDILLADNSVAINETVLIDILKNVQVQALKRVRLFSKNLVSYDIFQISDILTNLGGEYQYIAQRASKIKLPVNDDSNQLLKTLVKYDYISSYSIKGLDYKINYKRK